MYSLVLFLIGSNILTRLTMDKEIGQYLNEYFYILTEEVLMLIQDKNKDKKKPIHAECTLIIQPDGANLILRDSGKIFDLTDADASVDSFRQYVVANLRNNQEIKFYLTTTGYNRNEFFFSKE